MLSSLCVEKPVHNRHKTNIGSGRADTVCIWKQLRAARVARGRRDSTCKLARGVAAERCLLPALHRERGCCREPPHSSPRCPSTAVRCSGG